MKKFRLILISMTVSLAIIGALAFREKVGCITQVQYYYDGHDYYALWGMGIDFRCNVPPVPMVCTYYFSEQGYWMPCHIGQFEYIGLQGGK